MTAAPELALHLQGIAKRLGRTMILHDLNLAVSAGRVVVLRGSNGAGKTTLLRLLATRLRPTRGQAAVYGFDLLKQADEVRRRVGLVSVLGGNYPVLTARENLRLAARLGARTVSTATAAAGVPARSAPATAPAQRGRTNTEPSLRRTPPDPSRARGEADIAAVLERVSLAGAADALVRTYSSGMKKRLGLARMLLLDPALWLLDEPYAALDEAGKGLVDQALAEAKERGRTVLVASHDHARSERLADAVLEIDAGQLRRVAEAVHG